MLEIRKTQIEEKPILYFEDEKKIFNWNTFWEINIELLEINQNNCCSAYIEHLTLFLTYQPYSKKYFLP